MPVLRPTPHPTAADSQVYIVSKNGAEQSAYVLSRRDDQAYVHYLGTDKRLDEWVSEPAVRLADPQPHALRAAPPPLPPTALDAGKKRKRSASASMDVSQPASPAPGASEHDHELGDEDVPTPTSALPSALGGDDDALGLLAPPGVEVALTEEEYDILHHKQIGAKRNFEKVNIGQWQIRTWYWSPYPFTESEDDQPPTQREPSGSASTGGVPRATIRSHGRTSDLLAGGLGRHAGAERTTLYVCEWCFKYMVDWATWELHCKKCTVKHPPGKKVYQRGAHIIWEVDGAVQKLYCQNLTLFGKLFIDHKTLYFDIDRFTFYVLTDADSQRDHVIGFFSKEKSSYDGYNLACIVTLPPYQRKGYGMLMIEFSYEISRRSGQIGTPERPLSDLGLKSYLSYWVATLIRFFRRLLSVLPPDVPRIATTGKFPDLSTPSVAQSSDQLISKAKRKKTKGWDGEVLPTLPQLATAPQAFEDETLFHTLRTFETVANADGSATTRIVVRCTLGDIARATNLRPEDAAFALNECGLVTKRIRVRGHGRSEGIGRESVSADGDDVMEQIIVVDRERIEQVARERVVKKMCMDLPHVLL